MVTLHISNMTIHKTHVDKMAKCYLGKWKSKNHHIAIYSQNNKIYAIVKDVFGEKIILSNKNIKGGINGSINQDNLLKMIEYDRDKISATLSNNRNNKIALWIIPKLEAAGKNEKDVIQKPKKFEEQARKNTNKCEADYSEYCFSCNTRLFQLEQQMNLYLPSLDDRNEVKEIFNLFKGEEDAFTLTLEAIESIPEKRSKAENIACAYIYMKF